MWYKEIKQTLSLLDVQTLVDCALEMSMLAETLESRFSYRHFHSWVFQLLRATVTNF